MDGSGHGRPPATEMGRERYGIYANRNEAPPWGSVPGSGEDDTRFDAFRTYPKESERP
jgi:hypothetical protein